MRSAGPRPVNATIMNTHRPAWIAMYATATSVPRDSNASVRPAESTRLASITASSIARTA